MPTYLFVDWAELSSYSDLSRNLNKWLFDYPDMLVLAPSLDGYVFLSFQRSFLFGSLFMKT